MERRSGEQQNRSRGGPPHGATAAAPAGSTPGGKEKPVTQKEGSNDLVQQAKQTTNTVVDQVQQRTTSKLDQQKDNAATELKKVADAVRQMGDGLSGQEQGVITSYAADYGKKAAENIERLTNYLRANDAKNLLAEVENFGRRRPALLLGGAFILGLAGARFLKSSSSAVPPTSRTSAPAI